MHSVLNIPSRREVALGPLLAEQFGLPVCVANDASALAVGEKLYGQHRHRLWYFQLRYCK